MSKSRYLIPILQRQGPPAKPRFFYPPLRVLPTPMIVIALIGVILVGATYLALYLGLHVPL